MTTWEYTKQLKAGWNLGDTLDARSKTKSPTPSQQETAWYNPITTPEMIKLVADTGFDIFRIPVTWDSHIGPAPDYTIDNGWMDRVNQVVDYGYDNNMTVILNTHHESWYFPSEENYPAASEKLKAVWTQIANHFAHYGNRLIFESMNEPRKVKTPVEWNGGDAEGRAVVVKLNQDFVNTIRAAGGNNASRMLMVPVYAASAEEIAMEDFVLPNDPENGEKIIVSIHAYIPYDFALGNDQSINAWTPGYEAVIDEVFTRINKHFLSKKIPVIMGECGARKKGGNIADRVAWAKAYTNIAKNHGVPCIWWDNGRIEGPDSWELFGIMNRKAATWEFPQIVEAFI